MNIWVCIDSGVKNEEMARLDAVALEAALALKDAAASSVSITVVHLGVGGETLLKRALGMGADEALWIRGEADDLLPARKARALAGALAPADLILTGLQSETGMSGSVGPFIAAELGITSVMGCLELSWDDGAGTVRAIQEVEGGGRNRLTLDLPCVLGIQSGGYTPRYPALSAMLKAQGRQIPILEMDGRTAEPAGMCAGPLELPQQDAVGEVWDGSAEESAGRFRDWLTQRRWI